MNKPSELYQQKIQNSEFEADHLQQSLLQHFDRLFMQITQKKLWFKRQQNITGIYLYGPVGRGKTMIIDLFLASLPKDIVYKRYHYHAFMRMIHKELKNIQGTKDPLQVIAKKLKQDMQLLFLDEFFVMDMANAMILGDLLKALFAEKFILLTTSNCAPDELYKDGMFRERFLPAISAIKDHMQILSLFCEKDYRIRQALSDHRFFYPDDKKSETMMQDIFHHLTRGTVIQKIDLRILDRYIKTKAYNDNVVWFDFTEICSVPRSQNDYLVLADMFDTFMLSHVPKFSIEDENAGLYFTMFIDVLYDEHKQLILSAQTDLENLFPKSGPLALGFERTYSRLIEMQSPEYIQQD